MITALLCTLGYAALASVFVASVKKRAPDGHEDATRGFVFDAPLQPEIKSNVAVRKPEPLLANGLGLAR